MNKTTPEQLAHQIIAFYNEYDLRVSGKINDQTAFQLIESIEQRYQTDSLRLSDGTRIWNLIRIFLYSNFQKLASGTTQNKNRTNTIRSSLTLVKESLMPLRLPKEIPVCGFSSGESRKLYHETYYDIYLDPLYDIFGDRLAVFEWPEASGSRRKYDKPVYSSHYVPMHIPFTTPAFWNLLLYRLSGHRRYTIPSEELLQDIIQYISTNASIDQEALRKDLYDFISVFVYIKGFLHNVLKKIQPKAVLIRCGYGRFPMALSQACRELKIPPIELQHGLITAYLPAYRRATPSTNKDCVPEYLLAQGEIYAEMVRSGDLFDPHKVISTGYPYLQKLLQERTATPAMKQSYSPFLRNVLVTSQWIVASEIQDFIVKVATQLEHTQAQIGILFKPHPYDKNDYSSLQKYKHIILIDKFEDIFQLFGIADIHSTVYSTSGLEAMAFGIPNIFVDIYQMTKNPPFPYIVASPDQFIASINEILKQYQDRVTETRNTANLFFTPSPEKHLKAFFTEHGIL